MTTASPLVERLSPASLLGQVSSRFFPNNLEVDNELRKIEIVRVVTGMLALIRFFQIYWVAHIIREMSLAEIAMAIATMATAFMMTVGLLTPLSITAFLVLSRWSDNFFQTGTLGTSVLIHLLFVLILLRAGRSHSLDSWLSERNLFPKWMARMYVKPSGNEVKCAYSFALIIYATISFVALAYHLMDSYWLHGVTVKSLFLSSYLNKHYTWFRAIDHAAPWALGLVSVAAEIAQSCFQFLMIPLMFVAPGRFFVKWHGTFFFLISLLFISLSFLPYWELLLWWLIFFHHRVDPNSAQGSLPIISKRVYVAYFVLALIFLAGLSWQAQGEPKSGPLAYAKIVARAGGMEIPIVFDKVDLEMGDRWLLLYRKASVDSDWILTPLSGNDGQRLNYSNFDLLYLSNHNSDLLYFGTTLRFRRQIIGMPPARLDYYLTRGTGRDQLLRQITYDYKVSRLEGRVDYRAVIVENHASQVKLFSPSDDRLSTAPVISKLYSFDGLTLTDNRS